MRALLVLWLFAGSAAADELPTIDSEIPPALRITAEGWGVRIERVAVAIRSAPEPTFVTLVVRAGRERGVSIPLDVPAGTKIVGLGVDGPAGTVWGRPMPAKHARDRRAGGGALLAWNSTSAGTDHVTLDVEAPATVELALYLPPLQALAIETTDGLLSVEVGGEKHAVGKRRRHVVALEDIAGTDGELAQPHATETVALVATPSSASDFAPHPASFSTRGMRDLDKSMIRRRLKWFRPGLRQCFMHAAQWGTVRSGGAVLSFLILPDGTIDWAMTSESDLPAAVNDCLVAQVKTWEFPAADGNVQVNYPIDFRTSE